MRAPLLLALVLLGTAPAWAAEEPSGCDKFKWAIEHERAALTAPDRVKLVSGGELPALASTGMTLALRTPAEANCPRRPNERRRQAPLPVSRVSRARRRPAPTPLAYPRVAG